MGVEQSTHKHSAHGDPSAEREGAEVTSSPSDGSSGQVEDDSPETKTERSRRQEEYGNTIWLKDELSRERRLHRGIAENIILEDFRRGLVECTCGLKFLPITHIST